jgi:hypothetical protein
MKINITEAMDALLAEADIKNGYSAIRVELTRDDEGRDEIEWMIYAAPAGTIDRTWSDQAESYPDALKNLKKKHREARGEKSFTED